MERICKSGIGLFPAPKEISFSCNCPDSAARCKHVAAVLYGVVARPDQQPEVLFNLRQANAKDLVSQAVTGKTPVQATAAPRKTSASKPAALSRSTQAANARCANRPSGHGQACQCSAEDQVAAGAYKAGQAGGRHHPAVVDEDQSVGVGVPYTFLNAYSASPS